MVNLVPIASGKGGVGKSVFAANLGLALARSGKSVVLVDLDLGGSNLHTCLGLRNRHAGIGSLVWKQEKTLSNLLLETGYERLWFVPGDGLQPGTANLEWFTKRRIIKELVALPADFVLLDLGAGSSYNVVDFFLTASDGIIVITPEITSVLNAYSFLKTAAFRLLFRSFADKSEGRAAVQEFASGNVEAAGPSFMDFARGLAARFPEEGGAALERLGALKPRAVMNASSDTGDAELGYRLRDIAAKNLGIGVEFAGYLLADPAVPRSIASRRPVLDLEPDSPFSRGITAVAARIASSAGALEEARGAAHDMAPASRLHEALGPEPLEAIDCSLEAPAGRAAEAVAGAVAGDRGSGAIGPRLLLSTLALACAIASSRASSQDIAAQESMPRPSPAAPSVARLSVATLSLAEKAAQVLLVGIEGSTLPTKACLELLADLPLGGVILFSFNIPERTIDLGRLTGALQDAAAGAKAGIPLFVAIDHEGGSVFRFPRGGLTRLPPPSEVGRRGPGYARLLGTAAGAELRGLGVNLALAPVVELLSEGNKAVLGGRAYGREPATVDAVARAFIEGLQDSGCAAVAKHFPGNGALDPHRGLPLLDADRVTYERDFLPRFASAIEAGVSGVMLSHVLVPAVDPGRPATLSRAIVAGDLKEGLGFEGFALTDDLFMKALLDSMPIERSAVEALSAGADLLMLSSYTGARRVRDAIVRAVEAGLLPQERLDEAVQRVLAQKMRFQLAEDLDPIRRQARLADFPELVKRNQALVGSYPP